MDREHFPYPVDPPGQQTDRRADPAQDAQLIYLRQYGKYLAPGRGIDLVSGIAVVLRGFLLNLLVWLPIAALLLLVLLVVPPLDTFFPRLTFDDPSYRNGYGWMAAAAALASVVFIFASVLYSLATYLSAVEQAWRYHGRRFFESKIRYVLWFIVATGSVALLPFVRGQLKEWLASAGFASVLTGLASAAGTFLRSRSGRDNGGLAMSVVAPIGAILTLYGVLILAYVWAGRFYGCTEFGGAWPWIHRGICSSEWLWWPSLIVLAVALVTGHFVNVNFISVHRYYRDRLMEAFLPDAPTRTPPCPDPAPDAKFYYTDLASHADLSRLQNFDGVGERRPTGSYHVFEKKLYDFDGVGERRPTAPYHLLNTNVILVNSPQRTWRSRGGDSFVLSPLLCGSNATGWCSTRKFLGGDLSLATAMAISGAAANPYAGGGLFRNRPVALLMSLANLRLGYWVGHPNPAKQVSKSRTHFSTAWRELSGKLDENRPMLQLSDGGHFENLGIYELIRRRARLIVACDGTADPEFSFSDFITLLARIEADFGARITFNQKSRLEGLEVFMPSTAAGYPRNTQLATRGFTVGTISYSDESEGDLIYITTTLFKGLGLATLGYKAANTDFPDQTTADQFFDEAQFEAYRHLGYSVGEAMLKDKECSTILARISHRWYGRRPYLVA
jgi:hypothetical protein